MVLLTYGYSEGENLADLRANAIVDTFTGHCCAARLTSGERRKRKSSQHVPVGPFLVAKLWRLVALACQQCFALVASACVRPLGRRNNKNPTPDTGCRNESGDPPLRSMLHHDRTKFLKLAQQGHPHPARRTDAR